MDKKYKELLLIDLCARLPYNVICQVEFREGGKYNSKVMLLSGIFTDDAYFTTKDGSIYSNEYKPYLFPMSSMTEEQKQELKYLCDWENDRWRGLVVIQEGEFCMNTEIIDWLNKNHFDHNRLIEKGLAIDATRLNIY